MDGPRSPVGVEAATQDLAWSSSVFLVSLQYEPLVQKNPPVTPFAVTHASWGGAICVADGACTLLPQISSADRQTK